MGMTSRERIMAAIQYGEPDRLPTGHVWAYPYVFEKIFREMGISTLEEFRRRIGEDMRPVQPVYRGPALRRFPDGSREDLFGSRLIRKSFGEGFYEETVHAAYQDVRSVEDARKIRFPSPDWYDYGTIREQCRCQEGYALFTGYPHYGDFLNGTGHMAGVERTLYGLMGDDPVISYLFEKRFEFYYEILRQSLEASDGAIDLVFLGDDLGTQKAPLMSLGMFEEVLAPYYTRYFELAHRYGARTIMHCCGSARAFLPSLIDRGLDILEGVQVDAAGMDIEELHRDFYGKIVLCGSISVQRLLPKGTPEEIAREVELRQRLYRQGGLVIGPANGLQIDMPTENLLTLYNAVGSLTLP